MFITFDHIESLLIPCMLAAGLFHEALNLAEQRVRQSRNEYRLESAVMDKIRLLQKQNMADETAYTVNQYIDLVPVRKMKADELASQGHYPEVVRLIREGIRVAEQKDDAGTVTDWKDRLLEIYIAMCDRKNTVLYAEDLFYSGNDTVKYYRILKNETEGKDWPVRLDKLLSGWEDSGYNLAKIYIEEGYWDKLLRLVTERGLFGLEEYEAYLKPHFPVELLELFAIEIAAYAERYTGRKHYRYVAHKLRNLRTYPGGDLVVNKLVNDFIKRYKSRPAMVQELSGV